MRGDRSVPATVGAVVFDWAGTVVDFGSLAPAGAFVALFARHGVEIDVAEARRPMGLPKWEHIQAIGRQPRVALAWQAAHGVGRTLSDSDIDALYAEYTPMNREAVLQHADLVPGTAELVAALRARAVKVGSTTGYGREIIAPLLPLAREQGFAPDNLVCADDVPASRPSPLAMYRCFLELGVWPAWRVVKVDDTLPGLMEGKHAGCWTVAVTASGNEVGLSLPDWRALDAAEQAKRTAAAGDRLGAARPDYTVATIADLLPVIDDITRRLRAGERPAT
jgi:phosphonoacetaldehyde hydrolase